NFTHLIPENTIGQFVNQDGGTTEIYSGQCLLIVVTAKGDRRVVIAHMMPGDNVTQRVEVLRNTLWRTGWNLKQLQLDIFFKNDDPRLLNDNSTFRAKTESTLQGY